MKRDSVHIIWDLMHLYYKYKFSYESGKLKKLTGIIDGTVVDVTMPYMVLKDIEEWRKKVQEKFGSDSEVYVSICMDTKPTERKKNDTAGVYKKNRGSRITDTDLENIAMIEDMLRTAGYGVYKVDGYEADDLVATITSHVEADATYIFTNDADLLYNVRPGVCVMLRKYAGGYSGFTVENFNTAVSEKYKCNVPYNAILLYKSLCGDPSDGISGVFGFGPKAFDKAVVTLTEIGVDFSELTSYEKVMDCIRMLGLQDEKLAQAERSLALVMPDTDVPIVDSWDGFELKTSTPETRAEAYNSKYSFVSLV